MLNMKCKIVKLNEIIDDANNLYYNNLETTPYQNIEFMINVGVSTSEKMLFSKMLLRELNIAVYDDELIMLLPLVYKVVGQNIFIHLRGEFVGAGHLGPLYNEKLNEQHLKSALLELKEFFNNTNKGKKVFVKFLRIREDFKFNTLLSNVIDSNSLKIKEQKCLYIPIDGTRDDWYQLLSKSSRQSIRTSYNRIEKDNVNLRIETYIKEQIPDNIYSDIIRLYSRRILEKSYKKNISNNPIFNYLVFKLKKKNKFNRLLSLNNNTYTQVLYIDDDIAAFCQGYISNDNRIIIPHLSYNTNYSRYSPGTLLIDSCIRYITENRSDTFQINKFDLSCGAEKYKYSNGGIEYKNYHYFFEI